MARVLLVEDEIGAIAALKRALTRAGFEVSVATNLSDALSAVENDRPEALVVSASLHGESANSVVEGLRAVDLVRPLIVIGNGQGTGEPTIARPVEPQRLIALLHQLMPASVDLGPPEVADTSAVESPSAPASRDLNDEASGDFAPDLGREALPPDFAREPPHAAPAHRAAPAGQLPAPAPVGAPIGSPIGSQVPLAHADLARRRELAARALAEAQARRKAAELARQQAEAAHAAATPPSAEGRRQSSTPSATSAPPPARRPAVAAGFSAAPAAGATAPGQQSSGPRPARRADDFAAAPNPMAVPANSASESMGGATVGGSGVVHPAVNGVAALRSALGDELFDDLSPELPPELQGDDELRSPPARPAPTATRVQSEPAGRLAPRPELRANSKAEAPGSANAEARQIGGPLPPRPAAPFPPEGLNLPLEGSLDRIEPAALLIAAHRAKLSGRIRLDQGPVQRILFLDDGRLSGAASTSAEERLEALTYRRGLITRDQQRQLRADAADLPTRRLALLMVERSYLKPAELFPLVQERVEEVVYEACGAFAGTYRLGPELVGDDERVALSRSPLALATESIRRKYLMDRLLSGLGGPATLLKPAETTGPELSEFGLTARERRLAQAVDGLRNIEEILFESGIEPLPGLKVLYALLLGRSVEVAVRGIANEATPEVEARIDLARVGEKYEQVRSANYFEVLGVASGATAYEIQQAFERLAREFQPARFRELRRPELPGQLDEIQRVLAEARDILVDTGLREEYRAHLRK